MVKGVNDSAEYARKLAARLQGMLCHVNLIPLNKVEETGYDTVSYTHLDVYKRQMQGYQVKRKGGWDTHGLPVEIEVEKQLGFSGKQDIEAYGIKEFNEKFLESVFTLSLIHI